MLFDNLSIVCGCPHRDSRGAYALENPRMSVLSRSQGPSPRRPRGSESFSFFEFYLHINPLVLRDAS